MNFFQQVVYTTPEETIQNVKEAVQNNKLVYLSDFREDLPVHDFYSKLSETIGRIHAADEDLATGQMTGNRWIDITYDPQIPDRYRSSNTRQPLHTDDSYVELGEKKRSISFTVLPGLKLVALPRSSICPIWLSA